jgi:hypothetical protein
MRKIQPAIVGSPGELIMGKMKKVKSGVKGVLNQRVRMGFFTVPLWVVGAVYVGKMIRDRRRQKVESYA